MTAKQDKAKQDKASEEDEATRELTADSMCHASCLSTLLQTVVMHFLIPQEEISSLGSGRDRG